MRSGILKTTFVLAVAAGILFPTSELLADQSVQEECDLATGGVVEVTVLSGTVDLVAGSASKVLLTGTMGDDVQELVTECSSGRASFALKLPEGTRKNVKADVHFQVAVPANTRAIVSTVSADITSKDLQGPIELESVSGKVEITGATHAVKAASVSGEVVLHGRSAVAEVKSVSGNVVVSEAHGRLQASSVSGAVKILGGTVEEGSFESVSGDVSSAAAVAAGGRIEAKSHSGSVKIEIPEGTGASIEASTLSGSIVNRLSAERPQDDGGHFGKKTLRIEVGGGGGAIEAESFSGKIHLGSG